MDSIRTMSSFDLTGVVGMGTLVGMEVGVLGMEVGADVGLVTLA